MEIEFYKTSTKHDPKLVMDHIQRIASGETPPPSTGLSFVYDKLVERIFEHPIASGSDLGKPTEPAGKQITTEPCPTTAQTSDPPSRVPLPSILEAPDPAPPLEPIPLTAIRLECFQCGERARLRDLHNGLRCPRCPPRTHGRGRPFMQCPACNLVRGIPKDHCVRASCQARFV